MSTQITVSEDGNIHLHDFQLRPEVYGMLLKYRSKKDTTIPIGEIINNLLLDDLIARLTKPGNFKFVKLDAFEPEKSA